MNPVDLTFDNLQASDLEPGVYRLTDLGISVTIEPDVLDSDDDYTLGRIFPLNNRSTDNLGDHGNLIGIPDVKTHIAEGVVGLTPALDERFGAGCWAWVSAYTHGSVAWMPFRGGGGMDWRFYGPLYAGVWLPIECEHLGTNIQEVVKRDCDLYTDVCNGSVYAYHIRTSTKHLDGCGGFLGCDLEKSNLKISLIEAVNALVAEAGRKDYITGKGFDMNPKRCHSCVNCKRLKEQSVKLLRCCNPPFSFGDDGAVQVWNQTVMECYCLNWTTDQINAHVDASLQASESIRPRMEWAPCHSKAAVKHGWDIFTTIRVEDGSTRPEIQKDDAVGHWTDDEACYPHVRSMRRDRHPVAHWAAQVLRVLNPDEYLEVFRQPPPTPVRAGGDDGCPLDTW